MQFARLASVLALAVSITTAQQRTPAPAHRIYGQLQQLKNLSSVLYVAAHPDDENTRLLSWLATGRHIRTGYLSITRGDGGQNIIGSEQGAPLGLIRTHELLAARRMDGAEQYFARAIDFGYSKNPEETFRQWDSTVLTSDVVRVFQTFRPDVVICRFPKDSMAGHGQHSASSILAERAYAACMADPKAWKPKRLLLNAFRFGNRSTISDGMFRVEVGHYDPLLGMGYGELAGISRSLHRSQGAGTPQTPGVQPEFFATLAGEAPSKSLFDGIDTTWGRVGHPEIGQEIERIVDGFSMTHPERSLDALLAVRRMIRAVADEFWRQRKLMEVDEIIFSCMGLTADASVTVPTIVSGDSVAAQVRITTRAGRTVTCTQIVLPWGDVRRDVVCPHDSLKTIDVAKAPCIGPVTQPYWLARSPKGALFELTDEGLLGQSVTPPELNVRLFFTVGMDTISTAVPLSFKKLEPLKGDVIEQLRIVPAVSIEPISKVVVKNSDTLRIPVRVRAYSAVRDAELVCLDGSTVVASISNVSIRAKTDTLIMIEPALRQTANITFVLRMQGSEALRSVRTISYDHLPTLQYTEPAVVRVVVAPIEIRARRVAYVAGAGEYTPDFLRSIGVTVDEINDELILETNELLKYDAVLVGIRAVNTRKSMQFLMPALMNYVEQGGTLVMSYMTTQDMSTKSIGPFPFSVGRSRVTEEDAPVRIQLADHPILTTPNRITARDFDGWIQERGLYFADSIDERYQTPLSMHDTNEAPHSGALVYARYGKGHYIYCALSLFRQLPAGVPGGMRLLANMLSIGK